MGIVVVGVLSSCGSSEPRPSGGQPGIDGVTPLPGETLYHEWQEVWVGDNPVDRVHEGFLDRAFTRSDPDGRTIVRDRTHEIRGFILPSGRALIVEARADEEPKLRDLGLMGTQDAIRTLLAVKGQVELRLDASSSTAPSANEEAPPPPKSQPETGTAAEPANPTGTAPQSAASPAPKSTRPGPSRRPKGMAD